MKANLNARLKNFLLSLLNSFILVKRNRINMLDSFRVNCIGETIFRKSNHKILFGPFKGVEIPEAVASTSPSWCAGWILGTFEQQLLEFITSNRWKSVVNIGAAEGYYPVSLLRKGYALEAIAFESLEVERSKIKLFSEFNGVENKILIMGHAESNFLDTIDIKRFASGPNLMIVDIEGAEFDLFDLNMMRRLKEFHLVIEVHNFVVQEMTRIDSFIKMISEYHKIEIVTENSRSVPSREEISFLPRRDLMLVIAEDRPSDMFWILATPK